jgi:hypothetical protein
MLVVIFGAGASYDSDPRYPPPPPDTMILRSPPLSIQQWRPPLAKGLFEDRFGDIAIDYPVCAGIIGHLRRAASRSTMSLEEALARARDEAAGYPQRAEELLALRYYLSDVLSKVSDNWAGVTHGVDNYADLLRTVDRWRHVHQEEVCLINFNYDLLLDRACQGILNIRLNSMESYTSNPGYKYIKVHGSVNWIRKVLHAGFRVIAKHPLLPEGFDIIRPMTGDLQWTDEYLLAGEFPSTQVIEKHYYVPAIAVPTASKDNFECPPAHLRIMRECISRADRVLIIGWRGVEAHFHAFWKGAIAELGSPGLSHVQVVDRSKDEAKAAFENFMTGTGLATRFQNTFEGGFTSYVENEWWASLLSD